MANRWRTVNCKVVEEGGDEFEMLMREKMAFKLPKGLEGLVREGLERKSRDGEAVDGGSSSSSGKMLTSNVSSMASSSSNSSSVGEKVDNVGEKSQFDSKSLEKNSSYCGISNSVAGESQRPKPR